MYTFLVVWDFSSENAISIFYVNSFFVVGKVIFLLNLRIWDGLGPTVDL